MKSIKKSSMQKVSTYTTKTDRKKQWIKEDITKLLKHVQRFKRSIVESWKKR